MRLIDADKLRVEVGRSNALTAKSVDEVMRLIALCPTAAAGVIVPRKHTEAYDQDSEPDAWWNENG